MKDTVTGGKTVLLLVSNLAKRLFYNCILNFFPAPSNMLHSCQLLLGF
jgi:hypothetical protein